MGPNETIERGQIKLTEPHGSLRQAQKFLGKKINELGAKVERDGAKIRLDQYLDQWLTTVKSRICSKTFESYESLLAKYIRPSLGQRPIVAIRPLDVQAIYQDMTDRRLSPRTVRGAHWVLNAAFRRALRWEMILEVPTKGVKLPKIRRREMRVFSVEESRTLLKFVLPTMYGTLLAVAVTTGMRLSEVVEILRQRAAPKMLLNELSRVVAELKQVPLTSQLGQ